MLSLGTRIEEVPRVSRRIVPALKRLGIRRVRDLLFHLPSRYEDFSNRKAIGELALHETATIQGEIKKIANRRTFRKRMFLTEALVADDTGAIKAIWFNQPFLVRNLRQGAEVSLAGKVAVGVGGMYLQNPAYERVGRRAAIHTGGLVPVYPGTEGISSRWLRFLIKSFIGLGKELADPLPEETRQTHDLPELQEALRAIHFPKTREEAARARRRFNFEELLLVQLRALKNRLELKQHPAPAIPFDVSLLKEFVSSLPFALTDAQRRSIWEITQDLSKPRPMNRLLEGDVGSGKTVVAAAASLLTVRAGYTIAFMAPTEILARQHYETLRKVLEPFGTRIGILTGSEKNATAATDITVGTHALIQEGVKIEKVGLVVVDEQHRFGVEQRAALTKNGSLLPHFLSMSATPIPRTLALTVYGDLDLSILDEMPKSRKPVVTTIVEPGKRPEVWRFIEDEVKRGKQVFVICPRIEIPEPEALLTPRYQQKLLRQEVKAVRAEYKKLSEEVFPHLRVGMLHGKMKPNEKESVMRRFRDGALDILVSTSVVEVGVDIPNATVMAIEGAEKFGLAQLHQLRGRVGRSEAQSYCFLFPSDVGLITQRLRAVVEAKNGFELAEKDLAIRGPGDLFGIRQWGVPTHVLAAITDAKLVREVRREAAEILKRDPSLRTHPVLDARLAEMKRTMHFE